MAFSAQYIIPFDDVQGDSYTVELSIDGAAVTPVQLVPTDKPFILKYKNNGEPPYPSFVLSEATINFYNTEGAVFDLQSLSTGDEFQWRVDLKRGSDLLWSGFLDLNSCQEEIQDNPKIVSLKATDGIGLLKNIPFTDNGTELYEKKSLVDCIGYCLQFTKLTLPLVIECNIFEASHADRGVSSTNDAFRQTLVHTRSFMKSVSEYISCYEVIESICKAFNATFSQAHGEWHIHRFADRWMGNSGGGKGATYSPPYVGVTPSYAREFSYQFLINPQSAGFPTFFVNQNATRTYLPPVKCGIATYQTGIPEDIPRNKNFRQGSFIVGLSTATRRVYSISHWAYRKRTSGVYNTDCVATPKRIEEYDANEKLIDQYIELPKEVSAPTDNLERMESSVIEVQKGDKFTWSFATREKVNRAGFTGSVVVARVILAPDGGGTEYGLDNSGKWVLGALNSITFANQNTGDWIDFSVEADELPADGLLRFCFFEWSSTAGGNTTQFKDFSVDFEYRLASSSGLRGIRAKMCQNGNYRQNAETTIKIGDAPKKIMTGAFFRLSNTYTLTTVWHQNGKTESLELIEILARDLFRSRNTVRSVADGDFYGITTADPRNPFSSSRVLVSPINVVQITAIPSKYFLFTNLEIDVHANVSTFECQEFYDSVADNADEEGDSTGYQNIFG